MASFLTGPRISAAGVAAVDAAALFGVALAVGAAAWAAAGYLLSGLLLLAVVGRRQPRITLRLGDELPRLSGAVTLPALLLAPAEGTRALLAVPGGVLAVAAGRLLGYAVLRAIRRRGLVTEPTLLVGADPVACQIAEALTGHPELGLQPYGFVDRSPPLGRPQLAWFGDLSTLPQVVAAHRIRRIVVAFPEDPEHVLTTVLRDLPGVRVHLVPRLAELGQPAAERDEIWGIPLAPVRQVGGSSLRVKRAVDVLVSGVLLVALAPMLGVLAVAARRASGGSALFRQARLTSAGRVSTVLKLRTLVPGRDGDAAEETRWAAPDGRGTRFGRLLRTSHLDELPQLLNVWRGEMSLVGPRPERPYFAAQFAERIEGYADRRRMPAGITGWAQVHGLHGDTSIAERVRFDNRYIADWSLWTDLVILVRTLARVFPRHPVDTPAMARPPGATARPRPARAAAPRVGGATWRR